MTFVELVEAHCINKFFSDVFMRFEKFNFASNVNPLSANPTKWSNTLKQFVGSSRRIV